MPKCGRRNEGLPFEPFTGGGMREDFTNRNAPFGTQFTPVIRTKIVGGKPRYVTETQRSFPFPSPQNAQHQEAQVQTDSSQLKEVKNENLRASQSWQTHSVLPPIPSEHPTNRKTSNENPLPSIPTTLSKDPVKEPINAKGSSSQQHSSAPAILNTQPQSTNLNGIPPTNIIKADNSQYSPKHYDTDDVTRDYEWKPAAGYSYLPTQPINLSQDQEMFLLHKLAKDVAGCSLAHVRNVYEEMASHDHQLTGWGSYSQLALALQKHGIYPNLNTLRLLASTCVSSTDVGYVDYEKLLSFLIAAVKKSKELESETQNFYSPRDNRDSFSPVPDLASSEGQLLRLVQQQLLRSNRTLDVEKLRRAFSKADRSHRLTLSHNQIKDLCYQMSVPISEAVINKMISHCHSNGDGQYLWTDFTTILEKVQPHATGLIMPQSKKPLEYAKTYLKPSENWPHPDEPTHGPIEENLQAYQEIPPEVQRSIEKPSKPMPRAMLTQQISAPAAFPNRVGGGELGQASPRGLGVQPKAQPWSKLFWDLIQKTGYNQQDPWFDGFKKMAEALYRNDLDKKGSMKPEKCNWLVTEYNEIYDLQLPADDVTRCIQLNTTASGTVIDSLLQHLLAVRHH